VPFTIDYVREEIAHGKGSRMLWHNDARGLVPAVHAARARQLAREREAKDARARADAVRHRKNIEALYLRQDRVLPVAAADAADALASGEYVWAGVPAMATRANVAVDHVTAAGNEKTARAATIWIGRDRQALHGYRHG